MKNWPQPKATHPSFCNTHRSMDEANEFKKVHPMSMYTKEKTRKAWVLPLLFSAHNIEFKKQPVLGRLVFYFTYIPLCFPPSVYTPSTPPTFWATWPMDISLTSRLNTVKPPIIRRPLADNHRRFVSVSCSARSAARLACGNESPNYYKLLHLSPDNAGVDEIKRAYRRMSLQYHPDVCDPSMKEESTRMFVQLNAAYKTLSDPVLRMHYDYDLGLIDFRQPLRTDTRTKIWENQITGLKRRSDYRMAQQGITWGSRMRARNIQKWGAICCFLQFISSSCMFNMLFVGSWFG